MVFEIVIICPCAGPTGRQEEMGGVTKEKQNARKGGKKDGGRKIVVIYNSKGTNKRDTFRFTDN